MIFIPTARLTFAVMEMNSFNLQDLSTKRAHQFLLSAIGPRPIAWASTVNAEGIPNLSPFSYFNVFSSNPPILIFSPARRVRNNTTKHTLQNTEITGEVVINVVNYALVQQCSLSSTEYDDGVNEFAKAGLTMLPSEKVAPPRVKESPVQLECKVNEIKALGREGGAGNLIICEVVQMHVDTAITDATGMIDTQKIDLVARMGGNWYCRAQGEALFEVEKPLATRGMGIDALPEAVKNSVVLRGNDLGKLGNVEMLPKEDALQKFALSETYQKLQKQHAPWSKEHAHRTAQQFLADNDTETAWKILLLNS